MAFDNWGAADALGCAMTMPLVLAVRSPQMRALFAPDAMPRTLGMLAAVFIGTAAVFSVSHYPLICLLFPLMLFADLLLGFAGSAITVAGMCLIAMFFTSRGMGPFGEWSPELWVPGNVALQLCFGFQMITLFPVSVLFMERRKLAEELHLTNTRLTVLASVDGLTGIANRRAFDERPALEWERAATLKTPLSIAMIDLDYFKQYNDYYGHVAGDDCLRAVAERLMARLAQRADLLLARFGGEEFALLLPGAAAETAGSVAERIRACAMELAVPHVGSPCNVLTVSVGHATLVPTPGQPQSELIRLADAGLYQAKNAGRNGSRPSAR